MDSGPPPHRTDRGTRGDRPSDLREAGFRAALAARGGDPELIVRHEYSIEGGVAAATQLLARDVSAIVAASDEMALGTVKAGRRAGLAVPDDLSVVGYDDAFPLEFMNPPLTTVRQPIDRLAQAIVPVVTPAGPRASGRRRRTAVRSGADHPRFDGALGSTMTHP